MKMSLENIISKVKESGKKTFRNITLLTGISLASLVGCENKPMINPLAPSINSDVYAVSGLKFSGDAYEVKFKPTEKPYQTYETRTKTPNGIWTDWKETEKDENSFYVVSSTFTNEFGRYESQGRAISGNRATESLESNGDYHMNEAQGDDAGYEICNKFKVDGASAQDGDITEVYKNLNHVFGSPPHLYNDDVALVIRRNGGTAWEDCKINIQGNSDDIENTQEKIDASGSGIIYEHVPVGDDTLTYSNLEAKVLEILDNHNINH